MRVLIDLTSLNDNFSGIERYAACLSIEMLNSSNDFILFFKNEIHPLFHRFQKKKNAKFVILHGNNKLIFNQFTLPIAIYKQKADWYLFLAFPVPIFLFKRNMVETIHDICCWDCPSTMNKLSNWYFKISHRIAILKCRRIITISRFSSARIIDKLHYSNDKIWLIYCGVDKKFLSYEKNSEQISKVKEKYHLPATYYLSLSTIEPRKNLRLLVEAYSLLVTKYHIDIPLVLAGRKGWKTENLLADIPNEAKERIVFTGFVDDCDLADVYGGAELFLFPSMYEGFGMPPLEAMACGTNVVVSDSSSLPEVLGECAYYFVSNDINSLCYTILNHTSKISPEIKEKAELKKQSQRFRWDIEAEKLLNYLSQATTS